MEAKVANLWAPSSLAEYFVPIAGVLWRLAMEVVSRIFWKGIVLSQMPFV
jgi:hypothetical protein